VAEKPQRKGIPANVALPVLMIGAVCCFFKAFLEIVDNVFKYLNCTVGSGDTYCNDGTWSAGDGFTIALLLIAAGILMIMLSRTFKNPKTQVVQLSTLPPPPPPPPPAQVVGALEWTCPNCKEGIPFTEKFCVNCGRAVDGALAQDS
jgi:hypothetical protein